ncbi:O-linked N-acetylglucosamine transferase, SPINDLY family protein [Prochlorothrix hollandica]|uniref:O-linked N-acetylglucosamine transferase, SPINDLY family protein n=1 Tax=Prochlorothrix hollandica TaxID=1223 RepID=UPI000382A507|nr:hypothetical protein [Prochlorothrix hollandica]
MRDKDFENAIEQYKGLWESESTELSYAWYLGIGLLLSNQEAEAYLLWSSLLMESEPDSHLSLCACLEQESNCYASQGDYEEAALLRQHLREIDPENFNNILNLIFLLWKLDRATDQDLSTLELNQLLSCSDTLDPCNPDLLQELIENLIQNPPVAWWPIELIQFSLQIIPNPTSLFVPLMLAAINLGYGKGHSTLGGLYIETALKIKPNDSEALSHRSNMHFHGGRLSEALTTAEEFYQRTSKLEDRVDASYLVLKALLRSGGKWDEAMTFMKGHSGLLEELLQSIQGNKFWGPVEIGQVANSTFFFPYVQDQPPQHRHFQNRILAHCQQSIRGQAQETVGAYQASHQQRKQGHTSQKLKIGYLSNCFREHSVGWLARSLFKHHDRQNYEIYCYSILSDPNSTDSVRRWYLQNVDYFYDLGINHVITTDQIFQDGIDILVDLDSFTTDANLPVLAKKPAPIQVTWLGWDAWGLTAVDYYLVDPYAVPNYAQSYYTEKLFRLPQPYLAIDGFEIGTPSIRRSDLEIPTDAIVFFSGQSGYKRHPDTVRLQLEILKAVPNSYFIVKDIVKDNDNIRIFFETMAESVGVAKEQLRFLSVVNSELTHRANLAIADVVLDTYPYNGATTTLETLWMGIPLVTRVGQQFSARNSYTFMMNAGITEGIAWTDEEYVAWGIRLGTDEQLRKEVAWKLRQSRKSAPLWNGQQFTRDMEAAYRQMWERYCHG